MCSVAHAVPAFAMISANSFAALMTRGPSISVTWTMSPFPRPFTLLFALLGGSPYAPPSSSPASSARLPGLGEPIAAWSNLRRTAGAPPREGGRAGGGAATNAEPPPPPLVGGLAEVGREEGSSEPVDKNVPGGLRLSSEIAAASCRPPPRSWSSILFSSRQTALYDVRGIGSRNVRTPQTGYRPGAHSRQSGHET